MFKRLRLRLRDMRTIGKLITGAEEQAHMMGEEKPGEEHYLLSALNLSDGTAKRVFERIGADPEKFKLAINEQYRDALSSIGINDVKVMEKIPDPVFSSNKIHNSKPSGQAVMKGLYALKQHDKDRPLLGVHVINVIANTEHGVVARAFKAMGIEKDIILSAIKKELELFKC